MAHASDTKTEVQNIVRALPRTAWHARHEKALVLAAEDDGGPLRSGR